MPCVRVSDVKPGPKSPGMPPAAHRMAGHGIADGTGRVSLRRRFGLRSTAAGVGPERVAGRPGAEMATPVRAGWFVGRPRVCGARMSVPAQPRGHLVLAQSRLPRVQLPSVRMLTSDCPARRPRFPSALVRISPAGFRPAGGSRPRSVRKDAVSSGIAIRAGTSA